MKAKLLTIALFGIMSLSFIACNEEEVVPVNDQVLTEESTCECEGGIEEREIRDWKNLPDLFIYMLKYSNPKRMKGLILRITVVVMFVIGFSSFALIEKPKPTPKPQQTLELNYSNDFQNGQEEREIR